MRRLLLLFPLVFILAPDHNRAIPGQGIPVCEDNCPVTGKQPKTKLEPLDMLRQSIERYQREVKGYRTLMIKQERIDSVVQPEEEVDCWFREDPFSVRMEWKKGERLAKVVLYVEGENNGKLLVKPAGLLALVGIREYEPDSADARASSRYPAPEFGILKGSERTLIAWEAAHARGELRTECEGLAEVPYLDGKKCWKVRRHYLSAEDDGITEAIFYFDAETGLQVGSVLLGPKGELIGRYFFRKVELNPDFPPGIFTRAGLNK